MLSLVYSEIMKMLRLWGLLYFDAEIFFPHDVLTLPKGYRKQKGKESDQSHIITSGNLLVEVISDYLLSFHFYFTPHLLYQQKEIMCRFFLVYGNNCAINLEDDPWHNGTITAL